MPKILTIAIPTFNRSKHLNVCLSQLSGQMAQTENVVQLVVIDNASTDETTNVVNTYKKRVSDLVYIRNEQNIGADANIAKCYSIADTKYVWIFGDDDVLVEGALNRVLAYLSNGEFGVIHIKPYPYVGDYRYARPTRAKNRYLVFTRKNLKDLVHEVGDMFSFISGNIVNKSLVPKDIDPYQFVETRYGQINWVFSALFNAERNLLIDDALLAISNEENSGGYAFCKVFGTNYNILFKEFVRRGINERYFDLINKKMARELFPALIYFSRATNGRFRNYVVEDYFAELRGDYARYWEFWLFVMPICKLPRSILFLYFLFVRVFNKLNRLIRLNR